MPDDANTEWLSHIRWQRLLIWIFFILVIYELRDFFFVGFITFLFCYAVRSVVGALSRRLSPVHPRIWLDRMLTLTTFAVMGLVLAGAAWWIAPRFVEQSRMLLTQQHAFDPQAAFHRILSRTVGAMLMRRSYGGRDDDRYKAAFDKYYDDERHGEGWYAEFAAFDAHLKSGFEAEYEQNERERISRQILSRSAMDRRFDEWFLRVKAPALFVQHRDAYLTQWATEHSEISKTARTVELEPDAPLEERDEQIRRRILRDVKADPVAMTDLENEWEQVTIAQQWLAFQQSPEYQAAFRDYYQKRHKASPNDLPFDYDTYLALRKAYPRGKKAFASVLRSRTSLNAEEREAHLHKDFELATRQQLTHAWWAKDPVAGAMREHATEFLPGLAEAVGSRLEGFVRHLLKLPVQLATTLLLTLFICFDMLHLRESLARLRVSRIGHFYDEIVPELVVFSRLIGRSFSAQALVAFFNTLLTLLLLWLLGIENELLLSMFVFIGSFIPVLGVLLSGIPIAFQAVLQPDGTMVLALQAVAGIVLIHLVETSLLSPKIVGKVLHLHPVMVLAILAIGEHFFGIWGLVLGVPVAVYLFRVVILKEAIPGIYEPTNEKRPTSPERLTIEQQK